MADGSWARHAFKRTWYFLERQGLGPGFEFDYHYYGPYSEDLTFAAEAADVLGEVTLEREVSIRGDQYVIYNAEKNRELEVPPEQVEPVRKVLRVLDRYDAVSLELASTADFLAKNGFGDDPWAETRKRKAAKWTAERQTEGYEIADRAGGLLTSRNLRPVLRPIVPLEAEQGPR